ncbi:MAG: hypothetical protein OXB88_03750 [Bacteriovoracales bacterium]|nr:hypothetical protein [Bacteriovoracales bacterium]
MRIFIFIFLSLVGSNAFGQTDEEKRKIIESVAKGFDGKKIFYRWQSKKAGDNLLAQGEFTDKLYDYFMGMEIDRQHFQAGHGVYVSENPYDSSSFIRGDDEGSLIQVEVDKDAKYIDLEDHKTRRLLRKHKITDRDVYRLNPRVAVKYGSTWWAIKGKEGVRFRPFTTKGLSPKDVTNIFFRLSRNDKAMNIFKDSLGLDPLSSANPKRVQKLKEDILGVLGFHQNSSLDLIDDWIPEVFLDRRFGGALDREVLEKMAKIVANEKLHRLLNLNLTNEQSKRVMGFLDTSYQRGKLVTKKLERTKSAEEFLSWMEFVFEGQKDIEMEWGITQGAVRSFLKLNPSKEEMKRLEKLAGGYSLKEVFLEHKLMGAKNIEEFFSFLKKPFYNLDLSGDLRSIRGHVLSIPEVLDGFLALNPNYQDITKLLGLAGSSVRHSIAASLLLLSDDIEQFLFILSKIPKKERKIMVESQKSRDIIKERVKELIPKERLADFSFEKRAELQSALGPFGIDLWPGSQQSGPVRKPLGKMLNCLKKNLRALR